MATQLLQRLQEGVETAGEFVFQGEKGKKLRDFRVKLFLRAS